MFEFPWPTRKRFGENCSQTETGQLPKVERVRLVKSDFEQVALAGFSLGEKRGLSAIQPAGLLKMEIFVSKISALSFTNDFMLLVKVCEFYQILGIH